MTLYVLPMPKFSVIIPLYNKANFIASTLESIIVQTEQDFELIIVNDASTDASRSVVEAMNLTNVCWIDHETNQGLSATRNTGIRAAQGTYITFLDADDVWEPYFLERIGQLQADFPEARIWATNYWEWYDNQLLLPHNSGRQWEPNFKGIISFFKENIGQGIYNHGSVCFHRSVFETAGYYDTGLDFSEDIDFNIRANYHFTLAYSNEPCMRYRMAVSGQMTLGALNQQRVPHFTSYLEWEKSDPSLKKYLDFERYVLVKKLKISGRTSEAKLLLQQLNTAHLNWKQRLLLHAPAWILQGILALKRIGIRWGIKVSSY